MSAPMHDTSALHVLMTADAVGGVWQYAMDIAEGLRPCGVKVALVLLGPDPSADQARHAERAGVELLVTGLPLDWTAKFPSELEEASRTLECIVADIRPDLVHLNSPALLASARFACPTVAVCHSCVATWWEAARGGPLPEEFVWRTDLVRQGYHAADRLLAPTIAFAEATARVYDLSEAPTVVRNGRRLMSARGIAQRPLFAFTAGRLWDDGKNLAAVDRAAARLSLPVLAAGPLEGPNGAQVMAHHVVPLGRLTDDEIFSHLSARPIFVSAAKYEPFGLAVLEAAQAGCPLVLSDIPTFRELWDGTALFVDPDDDRAIASSVSLLASDEEMRRRMGEAARERAAEYSLEAMSMGILSAYQSLLPSKPIALSLKGAAA